MKNPVLLSGKTMTPAQKLYPVSMSLSLKADEISTCTMQMDADAPDIALGSWIQIWAPNGTMCVMYVKSKQREYTGDGYTISMAHTIGLLEEMIAFGEFGPEEMGGSNGVVAANTAIAFLLSKQTEACWTMTECDFANVSQGWKFTNTDIYSAIRDIMGAILDCQLEFDQTSLPWKMKLKAWPQDATMEMRRNRNIGTLNYSMDRSSMYTRVYPVGQNNLTIGDVNNGVNYLDRNTDRFGVVAQVIMDSTIDSPALLKAWGQKMLKKNAEPSVTVFITGKELFEETGETLDQLTTGRICRVPLPEFQDEGGNDFIVNERLIEISWPDTVADDQNVNVTLANEHKTIQGILNDIARGGGAGGSKSAASTGSHLKKEKEEREAAEERTETHFEQSDKRIGMVAGIENVSSDKLHKNYANRAAFPKTGQEGHYYKDNQTGQWYRYRNGAYVQCQMSQDEKEGYYYKAGEIALAINDDGDTEAKIDADKVYIGKIGADTKKYLHQLAADMGAGTGVFAQYLTVATLSADTIKSKIGEINQLDANSLSVTGLIVGDRADPIAEINPDGQAKFAMIELGDDQDMVQVVDADVSGNTLRIWKVGDGATPSVTFSKATSLSAEWDGDNTSATATFSVDAIQNNDGTDTTVATTSTEIEVKQNKNACWIALNGASGGKADGAIIARIDNPQYGNGWAAAYAKVTLPTTSSTAKSFDVKTPPSTVDGTENTETYTMSSATNDIAVVKNKAGTVVARLEHGMYSAGAASVAPSSPNLQSKDLTFSNGDTTTVKPDSGFDGLSKVIVRVPKGRGMTSISLSRGSYNSNNQTYTYTVQLSDKGSNCSAWI